MVDHAIVEIIKVLIAANQTTLLQDLEDQGVAREIAHLTKSTLTPPTDYYIVAIGASESDEAEDRYVSGASYNVTVKVADAALMTPGEDEAYENMHMNFKLFCNRIAKLIRDQSSFSDAAGDVKFQLKRSESGDKRIRKTERELSRDMGEDMFAMLIALIQFDVQQRCGFNYGL